MLDKRSLPAWSPWVFDGYRGKATAIATSCLVLDYDGGATVDEIRAAWSAWPHVAHSTWSHTSASPCLRLVLPLAEPIPRVGWSRVWAWAKAHHALHDVTCSDPGRDYFLPFRRETAPFVAWLHDAPHPLAIEWPALPAPPDEPPAVKRAVFRPSAPVRRPPGFERIARELRASPDARARLANVLGGRVVGEIARYVPCPNCGEKTVWWRINPDGKSHAAFCNHKETCKWKGWLEDLAPTEVVSA